jgi:lipoprotein LenA
MKKFLFLLFAMSLMLSVGCKKNADAPNAAGDVLAKKYARYNVQMFTDETLSKSAAWLTKGEEVNLLEEKDVLIKNKTVKISKIKLADDKIGIVYAENLCIKFVVFTEDKIKVYSRNTDTSNVEGEVMQGAIADVVEEKADWIKVNVRASEAKEYKMLWNVWAKKGFSYDADMLSDGKTLDKSFVTLSNDKSGAGDKEQAKKDLQDLVGKNNAISPAAKKIMTKYFGDTEPASAPASAPAAEPAAGGAEG